jgi:hypothetical protein
MTAVNTNSELTTRVCNNHHNKAGRFEYKQSSDHTTWTIQRLGQHWVLETERRQTQNTLTLLRT